MKNFKFLLFGVTVLMVTMVLSFRHSLNDYGVKDNKVHVQVLAQSNTTDEGGGTSGGGTSGGGTSGGGTPECVDKVDRKSFPIIVTTVCDVWTDPVLYKTHRYLCIDELLGSTCTYTNGPN